MHSAETKSFIASTAKDYDLPYSTVESIYNKYGQNGELFYDALEQETKTVILVIKG